VSATAPAGRPRVYLAGPEVFLPDASAVGAAKVARCATFGFEGVFPLDPAIDDAMAAFDHCVALMATCDLAVANMTPFRGPSMDVGTALEMGWMHARGRPVYGYSNVDSHYEHRVVPDGLGVESFDLLDNLMCAGVVERSTGAPAVRVAVDTGDLAERLTPLDGLDTCLRRAGRDRRGTSAD